MFGIIRDPRSETDFLVSGFAGATLPGLAAADAAVRRSSCLAAGAGDAAADGACRVGAGGVYRCLHFLTFIRHGWDLVLV